MHLVCGVWGRSDDGSSFDWEAIIPLIDMAEAREVFVASTRANSAFRACMSQLFFSRYNGPTKVTQAH